eukprot:2370199-Pleurochrysis_carterae.AAC.2
MSTLFLKVAAAGLALGVRAEQHCGLNLSRSAAMPLMYAIGLVHFALQWFIQRRAAAECPHSRACMRVALAPTHLHEVIHSLHAYIDSFRSTFDSICFQRESRKMPNPRSHA